MGVFVKFFLKNLLTDLLKMCDDLRATNRRLKMYSAKQLAVGVISLIMGRLAFLYIRYFRRKMESKLNKRG